MAGAKARCCDRSQSPTGQQVRLLKEQRGQFPGGGRLGKPKGPWLGLGRHRLVLRAGSGPAPPAWSPCEQSFFLGPREPHSVGYFKAVI